MRLRTLLLSALVLLPLGATPAAGNFHENLPLLPDREFVLVMQGTSFNGLHHPMTPVLEAYLGERVRFAVTVPPLAEPHTFHLHGHPWFVFDQGRVVDTFLLRPGDVHAFDVFAGGPDGHSGDWMYHCHVDAHVAAGMWGIFRVYPFATRVDAPGPAFHVRLDRLGEPLDGAALELRVDDIPVAAQVVPLGAGDYLVHADLPARGTLVVTATHALGTSVARVGLGGAEAAPLLVPAGHVGHGG